MDAIRHITSGRGTGKSLNIKGKSAKQGELSGFVPFLQIAENDHRAHIVTPPRGSMMKVFYKSATLRDDALAKLSDIAAEMKNTVALAKQKLEDHKAGICVLGSADEELMYKDMLLDTDGTLRSCQAANSSGIEMPERLLWQAYVSKKDISHIDGWETGRPSEPAFMDMNLHALRDQTDPSAVLLQHDEEDPMNPRGLLMAYEEDTVAPVVSDFDAFCIGSCGMEYEALPQNQVDLVKWCIEGIEGVLQNPQKSGWTSRWLEVLKREADRGFHPKLPKYGFGDPTSYQIMEAAVDVCHRSGAIRHGAECFNFYFPQELDEEFLVIWHGFEGEPWQYLSQSELRGFLLERVHDGFSFPLNPKWVLCDRGWYEILQALRESPHAKKCLEAWFPPDSGLLELIDAIHKEYPAGFCATEDAGLAVGQTSEEKADAAELELRRAATLKRAKRKLRMILPFMTKWKPAKTSKPTS